MKSDVSSLLALVINGILGLYCGKLIGLTEDNVIDPEVPVDSTVIGKSEVSDIPVADSIVIGVCGIVIDRLWWSGLLVMRRPLTAEIIALLSFIVIGVTSSRCIALNVGDEE